MIVYYRSSLSWALRNQKNQSELTLKSAYLGEWTNRVVGENADGNSLSGKWIMKQQRQQMETAWQGKEGDKQYDNQVEGQLGHFSCFFVFRFFKERLVLV